MNIIEFKQRLKQQVPSIKVKTEEEGLSIKTPFREIYIYSGRDCIIFYDPGFTQHSYNYDQAVSLMESILLTEALIKREVNRVSPFLKIFHCQYSVECFLPTRLIVGFYGGSLEIPFTDDANIILYCWNSHEDLLTFPYDQTQPEKSLISAITSIIGKYQPVNYFYLIEEYFGYNNRYDDSLPSLILDIVDQQTSLLIDPWVDRRYYKKID